jgi:hypothetical protein
MAPSRPTPERRSVILARRDFRDARNLYRAYRMLAIAFTLNLLLAIVSALLRYLDWWMALVVLCVTGALTFLSWLYLLTRGRDNVRKAYNKVLDAQQNPHPTVGHD